MQRIVFFVSSMDGGGAERVAALLCNAWVADGHAVTLVATYSGRGGCSYALDQRVEYLYLADLVGTTRRSPLTLARRLWQMRKVVRARRASLVISFLPRVNVATVLATRGLGVPVAVSERCYPPADDIGAFWTGMRRLTYPWAQYVVMQTERGRAWLEREIPSARPAVIPNPVVYPLPEDEPRVRPVDLLDPSRKLILAVGRLDPTKGFDRLIRAFSELARPYPDWDLAIVGEGAQRADLQRCIAACGIVNRVRLVGRVGNLGDWYARADLYVLSSHAEGFPNALLEAMAHGVPSISTACETGPADIVTHGSTGLLVDSVDATTALREAMQALLEDPERRRCLGRAARGVSARYKVEKVSRQWLELEATDRSTPR